MESQLIDVPAKILAAIITLCSTVWGKFLTIIAFMTTYFLPVKDLIHIAFIFVLIDMVLGVAVTVRRKGVAHILSQRLRDSLVKGFVYVVFIGGLYVIEKNVVDGYYITSKSAFAIVSGVELWSIAANLLILSPNLIFLRIFKRYLNQEMAKKLEMAEDEIEEFLNEKNNKKATKEKDNDKGIA
jgi:hypothetical protein